MTHAQIRGRFPQQQTARFLSDHYADYIVTSRANDTYCVYVTKTAQLAFIGTADEVAEFLGE